MVDAGEKLTDLVRTLSELADLEADTQLAKTYGDVVERGQAGRPQRRGTGAGAGGSSSWSTRPRRSRPPSTGRKLRKAVQGCSTTRWRTRRTDRRSSWRSSHDDLWLEVLVADSGAGIEVRERDRLVQPFERGPPDPAAR